MKSSRVTALLACTGLILTVSAHGAESSASNTADLTARQTAASPNDLLKWNEETLLGDYERHGRHNPKWDNSAKAALAAFARIRAHTDGPKWEGRAQELASAVKMAVTNGCNDPLVLYLYARYGLEGEKHSWKEHADAYRVAAEGIVRGEYAPIRKFYAALRASEALHPGGNMVPLEVDHWRREASRFLNESVQDKGMPVTEVYEACEQLLQSVKANDRQFEQFYMSFEPSLFRNWPSNSAMFLLKGIFYKDFAWKARGTAYADKVTEKGWTLFGERLEVAEKALNRAWELNPRDERIARQMITVELGQGKGRDRMELWFRRATDLNPNYYDAFYAKLYYLEPKWYGSREDMLEFGRECVRSTKWGGHVPLILRDAHEELAAYLPEGQREDYWKRPEVWKDLNAAFEKFFKLNPEERGWRHNYALYAYRAGKWDVLNQQLPLLGPINYSFFGGQDEYEKMVRLAKEHAGK